MGWLNRLQGKVIRTPDAIQIATAIQNDAEFFLTNDKGFQNISNLNILILDEIT